MAIQNVEGIENYVKGAIAQALVHQLFQVSDIPISYFGNESSRSFDFINGYSFAKLIKRPNEVMNALRIAPDFLIVNKKGELELIEVKYSQQGRFCEREAGFLEKLKKYWEAKIVMVTYNRNPTFEKPRFLVIPRPYTLDETRNPVDAYPVIEEGDWGIKPDALAECERLTDLYWHFLNPKFRKGNCPFRIVERKQDDGWF